MNNTEEDFVAPFFDSVTMDELQFAIGELESVSHSQPASRTNGYSVHQPLLNNSQSNHIYDEASVKVAKSCVVCSFTDTRVCKYYGINLCAACRTFVWTTSKDKLAVCVDGQFRCDMTWKPNSYLNCRGCRLKKAYDCGLAHPKLAESYEAYLLKKSNELQTDSSVSYQTYSEEQQSKPSFHSQDFSDHSRDISDLESSFQEHSQSVQPSPKRKRRLGGFKTCSICNRVNSQICGFHGIVVCCPCRSFLDYSMTRKKYAYDCVTGLYDCDLDCSGRKEKQTKAPCRGCRLRKAIHLGLDHPFLKNHNNGISSPNTAHDMHQDDEIFRTTLTQQQVDYQSPSFSRQSEPSHQSQESVSDNHASPPTRLDECKTPTKQTSKVCNTCSKSTSDAESHNVLTCIACRAKTLSPQEDITNNTFRPPRVHVMTAAELEDNLDDNGLPLNLERRYSRWLYGDFKYFKPGCLAAKEREQEVRPKKLLKISNRLEGEDLTYLTSNLDKGYDAQPIKEICTSFLEIIPSINLLRAHASSFNQDSTGESKADKKLKPLLTFVLDSRRTIVDRRRVLERRQVNQKVQPDDQNCETGPTLISPGENCDDSDDDDIIEIDCDA